MDIFKLYLDMIGETEAPTTYHRWSLLTILGAWIGRRFYLPFGDANIHANMYVMLMGEAGARKTTSINKAVKLLKAAGYSNIAASKTSKEKFLMDLAGPDITEASGDIIDFNLFGGGNSKEEGSEIFIAAEEFNVFVGNGNIEFLSLLGALWDYEGVFENKVKNSTSTSITNPTVSILAGNTATNFSLAFPIEAIGQGIFSRLLLIHGEKTDKKITIPPAPSIPEREALLDRMARIRAMGAGPVTYTQSAFNLIDKIYKEYPGLPDVRFESYNNRRLTHMLKLCLICAAVELRREITEYDVIMSNTILAHAEYSMAKALGEFGKAKNADVAHKVLNLLHTSAKPVHSLRDIWRQVHNDLDNIDDLRRILDKLMLADKLLRVDGGVVSKAIQMKTVSSEVDWSLLTAEEKGMVML